jgi:hypothetical protein
VPESSDDGEAAAQSAPMDDAGGGDAGAIVTPVIVDDGVVLADGDTAAAHLGGRPESGALISREGEEARELAAAFAVAVRSAPPFTDGTRPDACLAEVADGTGAPVVPVRVEAVVYEGAPALAYVLVTAADGGEALDRVEAWIVEPATCATRLYLVLPG